MLQIERVLHVWARRLGHLCQRRPLSSRSLVLRNHRKPRSRDAWQRRRERVVIRATLDLLDANGIFQHLHAREPELCLRLVVLLTPLRLAGHAQLRGVLALPEHGTVFILEVQGLRLPPPRDIDLLKIDSDLIQLSFLVHLSLD